MHRQHTHNLASRCSISYVSDTPEARQSKQHSRTTVVNLKRFIQICGIAVTLGSLWLIYAFILSEAWFGVMIALFVAAAGLKATFEPDIIRFGKQPDAEDKRSKFESGS
jgi:hypothetical protein